MHLFELTVASKYLTPRWRQLSVSIISLISVLVISLVVWLIVVFFSVTHGLEKNWIQKLIALTAPVRIVPTQEYYDSYYYMIDSLSANADYTFKTIGEKLEASETDPYDPSFDEEIPSSWPAPDLNAKGTLKDIAKIAYEAVEKIPGATARDYEMTLGNVRLRLLRETPKNYLSSPSPSPQHTQSFLSQSAYVGSFDSANSALQKALLPITPADIDNLLRNITLSSDNIQEDAPDAIHRVDREKAHGRINTAMGFIQIDRLRTPLHGWALPNELLPDNCSFSACLINNGLDSKKVIIPRDSASVDRLVTELEAEYYVEVYPITLTVRDGHLKYQIHGEEKELPNNTHLVIEGGKSFSATLNSDSIGRAKEASDLAFAIDFPIQGNHLIGSTPLGDLEVESVELRKDFKNLNQPLPSWLYRLEREDGTKESHLPADSEFGESVLLPKGFKDSGLLLGDRGYLSYYSPTASSVQEQRLPIVIAGFYDPGIIPIGNKLILANKEVTSFIRASQAQDDALLTNGINVRFDDLERAPAIKEQIERSLVEAGVAKYWKVETFREYEFTKDILQQLKSERNLFTLLAIVIIVVACSNIISMLIILVNDKKTEIGILRSMGASSLSIASIFGLCGILMGLVGSVLGIVMGVITLHNLNAIVKFLGRLQGHDMFVAAFYGESLPNEVSFEAMGFVVLMTALISLFAGVVPAIKACMFRPSETLRSE